VLIRGILGVFWYYGPGFPRTPNDHLCSNGIRECISVVSGSAAARKIHPALVRRQFFQVLLTAGYGYAHLLASRFNQRKQAVITLSLLLLTIASLPITPSRTWIPENMSTPTWHILGLLLASVGACYFLLSSTGPLLQSWFSHIWPHSSPYRLYTLSNLGSLLAIVSYPIIIEPALTLGFQTKLWSGFYLVFAAFCGACVFKLTRRGNRITERTDIVPRTGNYLNGPASADRIMWLCLPALSSVMLMATTNQLCLDVAVIPLLWLLPMGLYLLSFIACFHSERWYSRQGFGIALAVALAQTCVVLNQGIYIGLPVQIASYCLTLFVCCMICHGELVRLKPSPSHLTSFYLMISAGGALGGVFVTLVAPHVFKGYWEFHLGLAGTALIFLIVLFRDRNGRLYAGRPSWAWAFFYLALLALIIVLGVQIRSTLKDTVTMRRNFFGVLKVLEDGKDDSKEHRTVLMHGRIEHGYQFTTQDKQYWPTSYFGPNSGVGIAIRFHPKRIDPARRCLRVGVVGLGTGTIAAYGEAGDYFRFYEINPDVLELCNRYFSYRKDSPAQVDVVLGDARISMEREKSRNQPGRFDVLAIDAFSSDAIPVHLLTRECYWNYWYHLAKGGILAVHISSRYFSLSPIIRSLAELDIEPGVQALLVENEGNKLQETDSTRWILVTANKEFLAEKQVLSAVSPWTEEDASRLLFTDDYSNLFRLLKR
jgi:hypothetical protein